MAKEVRYETRDLYEAAALYASGLRTVSTHFTGDSGKRVCWFGFLPCDDARAASKKYWDKTLCMPALAYSESIRTLRDMLYAQKED